MKPLPRFLAAGALLLTALTAHAASSFEGKLTINVTADKGRSQAMTYSIKGSKMRTDINAEGHQVATILDMDKLEMTMLMPEQQMYMVHPIKQAVEKGAEKVAESSADVELTGKTETILGYKCNQALIKDKNTVTEVWMAEGLGVFQGLSAPGGGGGGGMGGMFGGKKSATTAKWEEALKGKAGFPLRVVSRDGKGKDAYKMEVTKIEPGSLPDSLFLPPAGYQQFQMPNIGGMLKGLGGGN